LAQRIRDFWRVAGFEVETEVILVASGSPPTYGIRSNLLSGLPRAPAAKGPKMAAHEEGIAGCQDQLWIGVVDAIVTLGMTMVARGWISREELATVYATAEQQQMAQTPGVDHPARRLAVHAIGQSFAAPIAGDRGRIKLVVDNDR